MVLRVIDRSRKPQLVATARAVIRLIVGVAVWGSRCGVSLASVMGPPRCHEHGTTWRCWRASLDLAVGVNGGALVELVSLAVGGSFDDQGVCS